MPYCAQSNLKPSIAILQVFCVTKYLSLRQASRSILYRDVFRLSVLFQDGAATFYRLSWFGSMCVFLVTLYMVRQASMIKPPYPGFRLPEFIFPKACFLYPFWYALQILSLDWSGDCGRKLFNFCIVYNLCDLSTGRAEHGRNCPKSA